MRLYVSIRPSRKGGGSNTFAFNLTRWAKRNGIRVTRTIDDADVAVVIAHCGITLDALEKARKRNCLIIHRIDEHLGRFKEVSYVEKHELIRQINHYADITVFQSQWVKETALPFLMCQEHVVILNGGDPRVFRPARTQGKDIGHITWSTIAKKRLDLVRAEMLNRPAEQFRLVGGHGGITDPDMSCDLPNALLRGQRSRRQIAGELRKMKVLFFPSEDDPCPNTVVEAILAGVPVCYSPSGGTPELVQDCGEPLSRFDYLLEHVEGYRQRCLGRTDLHFDSVMEKYRALWKEHVSEGRPCN